MDLGATLRHARERAGLSLVDLAGRTRIPIAHLRAIEENEFARVPAGLFVRSFIRAYAREVGVDPEEAVTAYRALTEPVVDTNAPAPQPEPNFRRPFEPSLSESGPTWGYLLVVTALLVGFLALNRQVQRQEAPPLEPAATAAVAVDPPAADAAVQAVATGGTGIQIQMEAQGLCWVRATADGRHAFTRLMQPGERETVTGQKDIIVRVGDPAAFSYSINGKPGQPLGAARVPVTVRFGPDGQHSSAS